MDMQRRGLLKMMAGMAVAGISPSLPAATKQPFTVYGAPALPSMTIAVAAQQGQLAKQADVSLKIWRTPDQLRAGVAGGQFKVMMSPSNVGVNLRNQGRKVGMVNILTNGIQSVVCKTPIARPQDLTGKRVIIPFKNDMPDIVFQALLQKLKIDIRKVSIAYAATPAEAAGLFLTQNYDAAWLPEPMASAALLRAHTMKVNVMRGFDPARAWREAFGGKAVIAQAGIIADVDYFHANRAKFVQFNQDLKNALTWIRANPQSAAQIGKDYLPAPVPALVQSLPHANLTVAAAGETKAEVMQLFEILMRFNPKLLGGKMPSDDFFLL